MSQLLFPSWTHIFSVLLLPYIALCSLLRFRRLRSLQAKYHFPDRASLSRMTGTEAHEIHHQCSAYEFPFAYDYGLRIAIFKTYALENIGGLLAASSDLMSTQNVGKRYEDTEIIFSSFFQWPPSSTALHDFVARMNYLHQPYIKSGRILNEDMLYVLYLSLVEPMNHQRLYEWRSLTDMEVAAGATFWYYIGEMMGIDYQSELGKDNWNDGIDFLDDLEAWSFKYEDLHLKRLPEVHKLGVNLIDFMLSVYPRVSHPVVYQAVLLLLGERVRHALSLPEPSLAMSAIFYSSLLVRRFVLRFLALPRLFPVQNLSDLDVKTGKVHHQRYLKEPWYVAPTFWARWGPMALCSRILGIMVPGQGGARMKPDGFYVEDLGPHRTVGNGAEQMAVMRERIKRVAERVAHESPFATKS
ncbi:hypothetical protein CDD82_3203 [Ophiocordyceps australis]|uniref:Uncharacterized protein n=1 Tax=Ophiocordyceps australis TaxID=1399860 RepID=A0A2C5ZAQ0_9HYPO|nr:hypothetical protein CDD82_3203 [Ophiocordyceps australis]